MLKNKTVEDITDWFWSQYILLGRCLWDVNHNKYMTNDETRFTYLDNNTRKCNWCGAVQSKKETPITTIKTEWVMR
jgi:hypothetical protein